MTMIEKVAAAIQKADKQSQGLKYTELLHTFARVAIEAMREPTEEMKVEDIHWDYGCRICGGAKEHWLAMIDAALKE